MIETKFTVRTLRLMKVSVNITGRIIQKEVGHLHEQMPL